MSVDIAKKLNSGAESTPNSSVNGRGRVSRNDGQTQAQSSSNPQSRNSFRQSSANGTTGRWGKLLSMLGIGAEAQKADALPICSFGPGGSYLVDWCVNDEAEEARRGEARTLAAGIERIAESLTLDLKGWLLAEHPARHHRIDAAPATLDGCPLCGHENQWPQWFIKGQPAPDQKVILTGLRVAEDLGRELAADPIAAAVVEEARARRQESAETAEVLERTTDSLEPVVRHTGFNISAAIGMAEVKEALKQSAEKPAQSVAGNAVEPAVQSAVDGTPEPEKINYAEGSWETENAGPFLFKFSDNLEPVSFRLPTMREQAHDTDTKATQNPDRDPGLPSSQRVLADNAGTRRSAQRLKGHNLRARRGARTERSSAASPEQGSLFGDQPDGQAA